MERKHTYITIEEQEQLKAFMKRYGLERTSLSIWQKQKRKPHMDSAKQRGRRSSELAT